MVVPVGIIATIFAIKALPSQEKRVQNVKFDIIGAVLIVLTLVMFIIPFNKDVTAALFSIPFNISSNTGEGFLFVILALILSLFFAILFFIWESQYPQPLFDISILKNVYIILSVITGFMASLVLTGTIFLLPFYLELIMGYPTDFAGLIILIPSLIVIGVGPISGYISDRIGSRLPTITAGFGLIIAVFLLYILNDTAGLLFIFIALGIRAISEGMFTPANNKLVMSHSPKEKIGSVSSLLNTARYLGLVTGVVVFNAIFNYTISNDISKIMGAPSSGAFQFSAPIAVLLNGFQTAFVLGIGISILILIFSIVSKENEDYLMEIEEPAKEKEGYS